MNLSKKRRKKTQSIVLFMVCFFSMAKRLSYPSTGFKNLEGKLERKSQKKTISITDGLKLLQMVSEPDTKRCASEEIELRRRVDTRLHASKDA